jgi:N-acetylmuramoyl-L-alanine amidase
MVKLTHSAGHALTTPGKQSPDGYKEWEYTNEIVKLVMAELDQYEEVQQKRIDDTTGRTDFPLVVRSNTVNSYVPDLHIDYHLNAAGNGDWYDAEGIETFVINFSDKLSVSIGEKVQNNLVQSLCFRNRGLKESNLHMLRETDKAKAKILIEFAFMTNKNEAMKMRTPEYQKLAAMSVVNAIVAHYKLKKKVVPVAVSTVTNFYTDKVIVPNTVYWQVTPLVQEYQAKGYKCYADPVTPKPGAEVSKKDPYRFVLETDYRHANLVKMELINRGYSRTVWESI